MYNSVSDSICFNLPVADSFCHSVMQDVCFEHFSQPASLYFTFCLVPVKDVKFSH